MNHTTDKVEFIRWYTGTHLGLGIEPSDWFKKVETNHQELRNHLGGVNATFEIEVSPSQDDEVEAPAEEIRELARELRLCIPMYMAEYDILWTQFSMPTYTSGKQKIKWGKHIHKWLHRAKQPEEVVKKVDTILSKLGEVWSAHAPKKMKLHVALSTDPRIFASLGHANVDSDSCFKTGGLNDVQKLIIGQTPNSFVAYISDKPIDLGDIENQELLQRFWGVAEPDFKAFHTFNYFPKNPKYEGSVRKAIAEVLASLIKTAPITISNNAVAVKGAFYNPNTNFTYHDPEFVFDREFVEMDSKGLDHLRRCMKCSLHKPGQIEQVELGHYCSECIKENAWTCQLTGILSMNGKNLIYHKGKQIFVRRLVFEQQCVYCTGGYHCLKTDAVMNTSGHYVNIDEAKRSGMKECSHCERWNSCYNKMCGTCRKPLTVQSEEMVKAS